MPRHEEQVPALTEVRLDVWLDVACLFPTRSQAAAACAGGKVDLNGRAAAAHKRIRPGDRLAITFPHGKRSFVVRGLLGKHVRKSDARSLYEETTPPLAPEVLEARRLERLLAPRRDEKSGKPSKKERRDREKARGW
jgi:ribosome-associated heat shock protein Hsp15